jgi:hypothetical protein
MRRLLSQGFENPHSAVRPDHTISTRRAFLDNLGPMATQGLRLARRVPKMISDCGLE